MARTTDVLQIKLEIQGDGTVKASLAEIGKAGEKAGKGASAAAGGVKMLGDAVAAFGVAKMVQGLIQINREAEQLRVSLRTLEGSQVAATERFAQLQEIARTTPLSVTQVTEAYIKLKNFGFDPLDGSMQSMIDTAATLGGGYETLNGIVLAFGQANAKGKLQGEEMLQLAERGVPVYQTLATALGKTTAEVQEMASRGKLGRDAIKLLADELGKMNMGAAAAQANTMDGAIGALKDNIEQLAIAIGDSGLAAAFTGLLRDVAAGIAVLTDWINETGDANTEASALASVLKVLGQAMDVISVGAKLGGVQIGVMVDIFAALANVAVAAGKAVVGQFHAMALAATGDFKGAMAVLGTTIGGVPEAIKDATDRMAVALRTGVEESARHVQELRNAWAALDATSTAAAGSTAKNASTTSAAISEGAKKARTEIERMIVALAREVAEHGKSETQILREEAMRLRAAGATAAQVDALLALIGIKERLAAEDEKQARRAKEAERLQDAAIASGKELIALRREQAAALGGPIVEASQRYADALAVIAAAEKTLLDLGPPTLAQIEAIVTARSDAAQINAKESKDAERAAREMAMRQVEGYGRVWLQGMQDLAPALTDGLLSGDWETVGQRLGESIVGGLLEALLDEAVVKPLQDAFMAALGKDGSFDFGAFFDALGGGSGGAPGGDGLGDSATGGGGWDMNRLGSIIAGGMMAYQAHQSGSWLQGAAGGAMAGASFGPWGMAIGAIVGALAGALGGSKDPYLTVGGVGRTRDPRTTFSTAFGAQQIGVRGGMPMEDFITKIQQFDQQIASLIRSVGGGSEEIAAISSALAGWSADLKGGAATMENLLNQRLEAIIRAAEPAWAGFLNQIAGVSERVEAFTALYAIRDQIEDLDEAAATLAGGPLEQLKAQLEGLNRRVDDSLSALDTAIEGRNPVEIQAAADAAQRAVIDRYNAEIQIVRDLESALLSAQQQARQMDLALSQRIASVTGNYAGVAEDARIGMITTRALVEGTTDPERALAFLDEFIGNVDAWLQASIHEAERLNAAVDGLRERIAAVERESRAWAVAMAERIASVTGDYSGVLAATGANVATLRGEYDTATTPEEAMAFLDEFVSAVDSWLRASIADVQRLAQAERNRINTALAGIAAQQQALQAAMAAVVAERDAIIAAATGRAQEAAASASAWAQAMAEAAQSQITALQEQLALAQQYQRVLDQTRAMIEKLQFSTANPLSGQARLELLDQTIAGVRESMQGATGAEQVALATRLMELLNQRLQLVQGEGLMQRPGEDYLALYNETLQQLAAIQALAEPEADAALILQQEIARLQGVTASGVGSIATTVTYTAAEQARLTQLAEEEAAIQEQQRLLDEEAAQLQKELLDVDSKMAADIEDLNAQAAAYYEWARTEGTRLRESLLATLEEDLAATLLELQGVTERIGGDVEQIRREAVAYYEWARGEAARLQAERAQRLQDQIDTITGGRPIDEYIADRQAEATRLLGLISTDLRAFLDAISTGSVGTPGNPVRPPRNGDPEPTPPAAPVVNLAPEIVIQVSGGDPQQLAAVVGDVLRRDLPQIATRIKREWSVA